MSRIGRKPIKLVGGVKVTVDARTMVVEGPRGRLTGILPEGVVLRHEGEVLHVEPPAQGSRSNKGYQGLVRALLANMVHGVVHGYERALEIAGVGYKAELKGGTLVVAAGKSHLDIITLPAGITVTVDKTQTKVVVKGTDRQLVGQVAAQVRAVKEPEPYKGKGIKYADEIIRRKVGKAGAK